MSADAPDAPGAADAADAPDGEDDALADGAATIAPSLAGPALPESAAEGIEGETASLGARGVGGERRVCVCRARRNRIVHRVGKTQIEGRVAAGDDVQGLPPVIGLSLKHNRLV